MASGDPFLDETFVRRFNRRRHEEDSVNACIDEPAIVDRVRALAPHHIVELGCGTGGLTSELANLCSNVVSVDQSPAMITQASSEVTEAKVNLVCKSFEDFKPADTPDVVVSGMAMHLVADLSKLCRLVYDWLEPGGVFLFSQRHPIRTANPTGDEDAALQPSWTVSDYFDVGSKTYRWLGYDVRYYHRTISEIISTVIDAGFVLLEAAEPQTVEHLHTDRAMENRNSPSVLLVCCKKPDT